MLSALHSLIFAATALHAAACTPSRLVVVFTSIANTTTAGFPISLGVNVVDDCANPINQGIVIATFSNGTAPLQFTPIQNGTWVATYLPEGPGTVTITVTATTSNPSLKGTVTALVEATPSTALNVTGADNIPPAVAGGEPVHQRVTITSGGGQIPFQVSATLVGGQFGELTIEPSSGVTPAVVDLIFAPNLDLPSNTIESGLVVFNSNLLSIPFRLAVIGPPAPALAISKDRLLFSFSGSNVARSQVLTVGNVSGLPLKFSVTATTSAGGRWLTIDRSADVTTYRQPVPLAVTASPSGLPAGTYSGTVHVSADDGTSQDIPVTMAVTGARPSIVLSQLGLTFNAIHGGASEPPQTFSILNDGQGTLNWSVSVRNQPAWLQVSPASGQSIAGSQANPQVTVTAGGGNLDVGRYYALIRVDSDSTSNSPQYLTVVLNVTADTGQPVIFISPSGVIATAEAGSKSVPLPPISVYDLTGRAISFISGSATFDSANWLLYSPAQVTRNASPVQINAIADTRALKPGVHRAAITLQLADGSTRVISILLQLTEARHHFRPRDDQTSSSDATSPSAADCIPRSVTIQYMSTSGYQVVAGWPATLIVQAFDNCGVPFSSGSLEASFSTGEPPVSLQHVQDSNWVQTWTPHRGTATSVRLSFHAIDPARGLDSTLPYPVDLPVTNYDPPVLDESGVIDPVTQRSGIALAAGSLLLASGQRLSSGTASGNTPYPLSLGDTSIIVGGEVAPLSLASGNQLQGILPLDLAVDTSLPIIVARGTTFSTPVLVPIASATPSLYSVDRTGTGQGVVYHDSQTVLADKANPAHADEIIDIECSGLGAVTPALNAGSLAPAGVSVRAAVNVTISGAPANVISAQLKTGTVGVYVVRATIPNGLEPADAAPVQVSIAERFSNQVTIAVR